MSERTYSKADVKKMRGELAAIRGEVNNPARQQKLIGNFMSTWGATHSQPLEAFVEQCAQGITEDAEEAAAESKVDAKSEAKDDKKDKPAKTGQ